MKTFRAVVVLTVLITVVSVGIATLAVQAFGVLPPIGNDHTQLAAAFECHADGTQTVTLLVRNFTHDTHGTITAFASNPPTTLQSTDLAPGNGVAQAVGTIPPGTDSLTASVTVDWPTTREDHVQLAQSIPTCTPAATTTTAAASTTTAAASTTTVAASPPTTVTSPPTLASTGSDTIGLVLAGAVVLASGLAIWGFNRPRRMEPARIRRGQHR